MQYREYTIEYGGAGYYHSYLTDDPESSKGREAAKSTELLKHWIDQEEWENAETLEQLQSIYDKLEKEPVTKERTELMDTLSDEIEALRDKEIERTGIYLSGENYID